MGPASCGWWERRSPTQIILQATSPECTGSQVLHEGPLGSMLNVQDSVLPLWSLLWAWGEVQVSAF